MKWQGFAAGLVLGVVLAASAMGILHRRATAGAPPDQTIAFSDKNFFDSLQRTPGDDTLVTVSGSLVGDGVTSNNTTTITCGKAEMRCDIATATQIGEDQVDEIAIEHYPIERWTPGLIVAVDDGLCATTTLNIERAAHTAAYVIVPNDRITTPVCDHADTKIRRTTVERSAFWRRLAKPGETSPTG